MRSTARGRQHVVQGGALHERDTPHFMTDHETSPELVPTDAAPITEITEELAKPDALAPVKPDSPTFAELGARPETVEALAASGIHRSFAIQEYALPIAI